MQVFGKKMKAKIKGDDMVREYQKCERLLGQIDKAFREYGKNRVFLLGDNLNDIFLRDIRVGAYGILENLKYYAETTKEFKWFIYIPSNDKTKMKCYKKEKNRLEEKDLKCFYEPKTNDMASRVLKNRMNKPTVANKEVDEKAEEAVSNMSDVYFENVLRVLHDSKRREEALVYIENFDWIAEFYDDQNLKKNYIKKIIELDKLKKNLVVVSLKQINIFEEKFFNKFDEKEVLNINAPNKKEIEILLHRISWMTLGCELSLDYEMLASQFSNSNNSLRECSKIFRKKLEEHKEKLSLEDFEFKTKVEEKVSWDDVVLNKDLKNDIEREMKKFLDGEAELKKGMILTGPPGTGKTFIAKALANKGKVYFMCPKLSDLKGQYVGQSAPKIKALFEEARQNEPTLIFLDEIDTLFPLRDSNDGDSYTKDITNEFLQQLDGVDTGTQKIFIVAATNRIESIDPAVRSRLGKAITIDLPGEEEREVLFKSLLKKNGLDDGFWKNLSTKYYNDLKKRSDKMSGRDIKNFCSYISKFLEEDEDIKNLNSDIIYKKYFDIVFQKRKEELVENLKRTTGIKCLYPSEISSNELIGIDKIKNKINSVVSQIKEIQKEKRKKYKIDLQNGILLYGPPGNGKSKVVEEVAKQQNTLLIKIESKDVVGYSTRDTLGNLDEIFRQAIQLSKICEEDEGVILFFDEFDSLVGPDMNNALRGTILGLLSDDRNGIRSNDSKLILIGATNFYNIIDEAVKRKGRFDVHLLFDNPTEEVAVILIKEFFEGMDMCISVEDELKTIKVLYNELKEHEFKAISNMLKNAGIRGKEFEERIEEAKKDFRVSTSAIRSEIIEIKRYIVENEDISDKIFVTDSILEKYNKNR